jgi:hypothetical protein
MGAVGDGDATKSSWSGGVGDLTTAPVVVLPPPKFCCWTQAGQLLTLAGQHEHEHGGQAGQSWAPPDDGQDSGLGVVGGGPGDRVGMNRLSTRFSGSNGMYSSSARRQEYEQKTTLKPNP